MRTFLVVSSIGLVLGCNGMPSPPALDAGGDGGGASDGGRDAGTDAGTDAFVAVDAGHDASADASSDAGGDASTDASTGCSAATCNGTHACVRNVCILTCAYDTTTFDAALSSGLQVVRSVCRAPAAITFAGTHVYDLTTSRSGMDTTFTLSRWTPNSETPAVTTVATAHYVAAASTTMVFVGGYVAVSSDEMHAVFGYTTSLSGFVGGVFDVATGSGVATAVPANGNFDAEFADTTHYLVDGTPSGAQGIYRAMSGGTTFTRVVDHIGDASGSVVLWNAEGVVLAGGSSFGGFAWADGATSGDRVLVLNAAALLSATTPINGATVQQLSMPSSFEWLPGARAASTHWGATGVDSIVVRTLTRASGTGVVTVSAPSNLTTGAAFTSVAAAGTDVVLGFEGGLLFVH